MPAPRPMGPPIRRHGGGFGNGLVQVVVICGAVIGVLELPRILAVFVPGH
jgi:hypothetical protein